MPEAVLKETAPVPVPARPMVMRKLDELGDGDSITLGCPMLTRTRLALHTGEGLRAGRCSLGWALHGEDEVRFCLHTPNSMDCWKAHPERVEVILAEIEKKADADHAAD
jgi:hypothetical protein